MKLLAYIIAGIIAVPVLYVAIMIFIAWPLFLFDSVAALFAWGAVVAGTLIGYAVYNELEDKS